MFSLFKNKLNDPSGIQITKNFDVSVIVKHSYHFLEGLPIEQQRHVNQNKITIGFLKITFYSLEKVTSLLGEKSVFFCHYFKIFKILFV